MIIDKKIRIKIQHEDFNVERENMLLTSFNTGAIVNFIGIVREAKKDKKLLSLNLEHYPKMTENEILKIVKKAKKRWKFNNVTVIHRVGKLFPHENIVYVGVSSSHRQDAFNATNFIMDWLKTKAPIWKLEEFEEKSVWVEEKNQDKQALNKWFI